MVLVMHGIRHLLTPGTPGYAALRVGAMASLAGLGFAARRRGRRNAPEAPSEPGPARSRSPHPRSKKKRRRRR